MGLPQRLPLFDVADNLADGSAPSGDGVTRILRAIRAHLGMDVAFASEIKLGQVFIRHADMVPDGPFAVGDAFRGEDGYCQRIVDGRLPYLMPDTSEFAEAAALECTSAMPVGAHLSVPILLKSGRVYGTFCCFSFQPDRTLNERDLQMLQAFAALAAEEIDTGLDEERHRAAIAGRIADVIARDQIRMVYQPIYNVGDARIVGLECLARFPDCEARPPSAWFNEAMDVGLEVELELAAVRAALAGAAYLPDDLYLAVNASPAVILTGALLPLLAELRPNRLVVEITEHAAVEDYQALADALKPLRKRAQLAIDDVGAGYSGMRHILDLRPDLIKLDMSLVRDIDKDPARRALAVAMVAFASGIGSSMVAEGVETAEELSVLNDLGVQHAQGYHLARPMPLMAVSQLLLDNRDV